MADVHMLVNEEIGFLGYRKCLCCYTPKENYTKEIEFVTCKMCLNELKKIKDNNDGQQLKLF